ncbi:MAG: cytochrome c5 family protein [Burkholderiales bacterium]|nr:cytochrome c5 family protein [Burkholderiales bacterium]
MSDNADHAAHGSDEAPTGPIKTPGQLIVVVVLSFLIPILGIILLVNFVDFGTRTAAGSDTLEPQAVALRIAPVGAVSIRDAASAGAPRSGEQVFQAQCTSCHTAGMLGAPKFGDAAAWAPRIKTGFDALWHSALKGKNAMPPQGGGDFSDLEVARGVVYMANHAGASFPEPAAPAASAATAAAAASAPT